MRMSVICRELNISVFSDPCYLIMLNVPKVNKEAYATSEEWYRFANILEVDFEKSNSKINRII